MSNVDSNTSLFGTLKPKKNDRKLEKDDTPESIMSEVNLAADDNTGVFFFRHKRCLYMRFVEFN